MTWYVVDGMDGSGKSSIADTLCSCLSSNGRKVIVLTHPNTDTFIGRLERKALTIEGKPALIVTIGLYIADVLSSLSKLKRLQRIYDDVVFVRYTGAVAYLPESICPIAYRTISNILPKPDVRLFVDVDAETAMRRIRSRGDDVEVFETVERLESTRSKLRTILADWEVIDNTGTIEESRLKVEECIRSRS